MKPQARAQIQQFSRLEVASRLEGAVVRSALNSTHHQEGGSLWARDAWPEGTSDGRRPTPRNKCINNEPRTYTDMTNSIIYRPMDEGIEDC